MRFIFGLRQFFLFCAVVVVFPVLVAAQSPENGIQPVFRFPLEAGYRSLCVQGNNGSFSHQFTTTLYDLDFDTPNVGQPQDPQSVVAAADGIAYTYDGCVLGDSSCNNYFGNHVKISHGSDVFSIYAHLDSISITNGQRVRAGDRIGIEGSTGNSQGDHLHFGVHTGNAQEGPVGTSVELEHMAVTNVTENSGVQTLQGADFTCALPGGHSYEAAEVPVCHTLDSRQPISKGYGAAYDVFSASKELLLRATCTPDDTRITVGYNNEHTYIYQLGYQWINNNWEQIELQCIGEMLGNAWCVGEAIGVISSQSPYFVAYTCRWKGNIIDGSWGCGCKDQQCAQSLWQLQKVQ